MRRYWVVALAVLTLLGVLSPPAFAQAPAPKVTITGFVDEVVNWSRNMSQTDVPVNISTNVHGGVTNPGDKAMYGRTRGRFDIIGELGKAKAVLGYEFDLTYGQTGGVNTGAAGIFGSTQQPFGTSAGFGANNDVRGVTEIKWLYIDFPFSGPGSLLPFVPWAGSMTLGGQPYALGLKPSILADSDFAGGTIRMTISPTLQGSLTFAQLEERYTGHQDFNSGGTAVVPPAGSSNFGRGDDWGVIFKADYQATKELRVSPIYAYQELAGTTSGYVRKGVGFYGVGAANYAPDGAASAVPGTAGAVTTCLGTALPGFNVEKCRNTEEVRNWVGVDARYEKGPLYIAPTVFYQWGKRERFESASDPGANSFDLKRRSAHISAWIADVEAGYRLGPLLLQTRAMYTTGNKARDNLNREVGYYQAFQTDSTYYAGWGETVPLASIDYFQGLYTGAATFLSGLFEGNNIGYDRYGRAQFSVKGTYDLTPAISLYGIVTPMWTAQSVPTDHGLVTQTGIGCVHNIGAEGGAPILAPCTRRDSGNENYLGTDLAAGFTYRFAPGLAFDWVAGMLVAGPAYDTVRDKCMGSLGTFCGANGVLQRADSQNVYTTTARVRFSF